MNAIVVENELWTVAEMIAVAAEMGRLDDLKTHFREHGWPWVDDGMYEHLPPEVREHGSIASP